MFPADPGSIPSVPMLSQHGIPAVPWDTWDNPPGQSWDNCRDRIQRVLCPGKLSQDCPGCQKYPTGQFLGCPGDAPGQMGTLGTALTDGGTGFDSPVGHFWQRSGISRIAGTLLGIPGTGYSCTLSRGFRNGLEDVWDAVTLLLH